MIKGAIRIIRDLISPTTPAARDYARLDIVRFFARFVFPRYRFEWPMLDWWDNPEFNAYLDRFNQRKGLVTRNRWMVHELLKLVERVPGDTAECGVFEGATSYLICAANNGGRRHHFVFDSFQGLSQPGEKDGPEWSAGMMASPLERAKANLPFPNLSFHPGWIPERFPDVADRRFAFVHVDVDLYQPTLDSFNFFYPRLNPGGIIVCDDYGCTGCPGATRAVDEFMAGKPEKVVAPPCGGGFVIKS
jgi:hypothetical protein